LLVIGHPGHELRTYGWVAEARPRVCILTDGSGSDGTPRIEHTLKLLEKIGATFGSPCGELSDRRIYEHVLKGEHAPFGLLRDRLARVMVDARIESVVSDGIEGYNPTHDICEVVTSSAVALASRECGRNIRHFAVALMGDPRKPAGFPRTQEAQVELSDAVYLAKRETTRDYARLGGPTLQQEIEDTLRTFGEDAFRREPLFAAIRPGSGWERRFEHEKPFYETYGEKQVAAGRYNFVIRFREHVLPLTTHLATLAGPGIEGGESIDARIDHQ